MRVVCYNKLMYNFNSFSEFGALIIIAIIIFVVIMPLIVLFQFFNMTSDVKRIRHILDSWHKDGLPPTISPIEENVMTSEEIRLK